MSQFLDSRELKGLKTYGETLDTASGYDWKQMILEELGDALMYMTKYADEYGPNDVADEATMLVMLMATLQEGLRGKDEEPDAVSDGGTGGIGGPGRPRIIVPRKGSYDE